MAKKNPGLSAESLRKLRRLPSRSLEDLLQLFEGQVADLARSPFFHLQLKNGGQLQGEFVRYDAPQRVIWLHHLGALAWVSSSEVSSLSLDNLRDWESALEQNREVEPDSPPSRLQLKRVAAESASHLHPTQLEIHWNLIPGDEGSCLHMRRFLQALRECWDRIAGEPLGREALKGILKVAVQVSPVLKPLEIKDGLCTIYLTQGERGLISFPREQLLYQLEKAL